MQGQFLNAQIEKIPGRDNSPGVIARCVPSVRANAGKYRIEVIVGCLKLIEQLIPGLLPYGAGSVGDHLRRLGRIGAAGRRAATQGGDIAL